MTPRINLFSTLLPATCACFISLSGFCGPKLQYEAGIDQKSCHALFQDLAKYLFAKGSRGTVRVARLDQLKKIFPSFAGDPNQLVSDLASFLELAKNRDGSLLSRVAKSLKEDESTQKLLVCIMDRHCVPHPDIPGEFIAQTPTKVDVQFVPFGIPQRTVWNPTAERQASDLDPDTPQAIFLKGDSSFDGLLEESTHHHDFKLTEKWILANEKRAKPDALFTKFVREGRKSKYELDDGFHRLFLETRGTIAKLEWMRHTRDSRLLVRGNDVASLENQAAHYVNSHSEVTDFTRAAIKELTGKQYGPRTAFEIALELEKMMQATIDGK